MLKIIKNILLITVIISSLSSCTHDKKNNDEILNIHKECVGMQHQILFLETTNYHSSRDQFQLQQQLFSLNNKYNHLHCDKILVSDQ